MVWFAGHSSVTSAINDPYGALYNNCLNLVRLREKAPEHARLIYASSASLYSTAQHDVASELPLARESDPLYANLNAYDMSKFVFDYIAKGFLKNFSGLRLGTVSGWSPNLRRELLFNAMNLSAQEKGKVMVANPQASRSILFLDDLFEAVWACIRLRKLKDGFYNLASATATVGEFGQAIASHYGAQLEWMPPSLTYSFRLDTAKAQEELGITFRGDLDQRCQQFLSQLQAAQPASSQSLVA
nr:NAD(P)-dependent oxidoreductase [Novosphingobium umbonatum]